MNVIVLTKKRASGGVGGRLFKKTRGEGNYVSVRMTPLSIDTVSASICVSDDDDGAEHKFHFRSWWHEYGDESRGLRWVVTGGRVYNWGDTRMDQICATGRGAHFCGLDALRYFHSDPGEQYNLTKPFKLAAAGLHAALTARFARTLLAALRFNVRRRRLRKRVQVRIALLSASGALSRADTTVVKLVAAWL